MEIKSELYLFLIAKHDPNTLELCNAVLELRTSKEWVESYRVVKSNNPNQIVIEAPASRITVAFGLKCDIIKLATEKFNSPSINSWTYAGDHIWYWKLI